MIKTISDFCSKLFKPKKPDQRIFYVYCSYNYVSPLWLRFRAVGLKNAEKLVDDWIFQHQSGSGKVFTQDKYKNFEAELNYYGIEILDINPQYV